MGCTWNLFAESSSLENTNKMLKDADGVDVAPAAAVASATVEVAAVSSMTLTELVKNLLDRKTEC